MVLVLERLILYANHCSGSHKGSNVHSSKRSKLSPSPQPFQLSSGALSALVPTSPDQGSNRSTPGTSQSLPGDMQVREGLATEGLATGDGNSAMGARQAPEASPMMMAREPCVKARVEPPSPEPPVIHQRCHPQGQVAPHPPCEQPDEPDVPEGTKLSAIQAEPHIEGTELHVGPVREQASRPDKVACVPNAVVPCSSSPCHGTRSEEAVPRLMRPHSEEPAQSAELGQETDESVGAGTESRPEGLSSPQVSGTPQVTIAPQVTITPQVNVEDLDFTSAFSARTLAMLHNEDKHDMDNMDDKEETNSPHEEGPSTAAPDATMTMTATSLFTCMEHVSLEEYEGIPQYLRAQFSSQALNDAVDSINKLVNSKRFASFEEVNDECDCISENDLRDSLGYGIRSQALLLLLKNCGRLSKRKKNCSGGNIITMWLLKQHRRS